MIERISLALSRRGPVQVGLSAVLALAVASGLWVVPFLQRDVPATYEDPLEHFKYGWAGAEAALELPRPIFEVLPSIFEDLLPPGTGQGYERLGFIYEPGRALPVGISERSRFVPLVGLNCAACHAGTLRRAPGDRPELLPGAPSARFNSGAFLQFLVEVGSDPRFEPGRLFAAMQERHIAPGWGERMLYRLVVIPRLKARLEALRRQLSWMQRRPAFGPGRADALSASEVLLGAGGAPDERAGTVDYPPLYNQRIHRGATTHWDGRGRLAAWLQDLQPPVFPRARIDLALAARGKAAWDRECADCHAIGGRLVGQVTPALEVGTEPGRTGYANAALDGVWVRSPYLHNGSVPTLYALLHPEERPEVFFRGYDAYDWERVGNVSSGAEAEKEGFRFDTRLPGNGNAGHLYGTRLPEEEKKALLEYLKTL